VNWLQKEKIKDKKEEKKSKVNFINEIKKIDPVQIKNTPVVEKKYTLWQRLKQTLGMN